MANIEKLLGQMHREPANVGFNDLKKVCRTYFGKPRQDGRSHAIVKTPEAALKGYQMNSSSRKGNYRDNAPLRACGDG